MILEEQRYVHEDLERLEQGIADRVGEEPKLVSLSHWRNSITRESDMAIQIRDRLNRDHEVSQLLDQIQKQSAAALSLYQDTQGSRSKEIQQIGSGEPMEEFYRLVNEIRDHHARYPNEQAENSELRYRTKKPGESAEPMPSMVDLMFSGEEAFGRFFDLHTSHEAYINLPNVKRLTYLQYLEVFDNFAAGAGGLKKADKLTDTYFRYVGDLAAYLESFMQRTKPLENLPKVFAGWDQDFAGAWEKNEISLWQEDAATAKASESVEKSKSTPAFYCEDCEKQFANENVYKGHLSGRKHIKMAEQRASRTGTAPEADNATEGASHNSSAARLKERAVAEREFRVKRLAGAMSTEREDTRVNVERRQGMTERERQQELETLFSTASEAAQQSMDVDEADDDAEERIANPLRLPLAWDGKPIPFWLYRLHGLGQELPCEICGNFIYMGRRAFDKHFNEARHIYGLKCLGITQSALFRDITSIDEALKLWDKIQRDKKRSKVDDGSVVQMEDAEGNVMPEKVYYDLQKQGLL
jgi:splicing factor 3A subunit 3